MTSTVQQNIPSTTSTNVPQSRPAMSSQPSRTSTATAASTGQYAEYSLSSIRHRPSTRTHVMKLHAPRPIDPLTAEDAWTHPLKLHRRDPNMPVMRTDEE